MIRNVILSPEAQSDLFGIYDYIAGKSGDDLALAYYRRIKAFYLGFADYPERGTLRVDLRPGLRVVGFERRVAIAFHLEDNTVVIDRILYGGGI